MSELSVAKLSISRSDNMLNDSDPLLSLPSSSLNSYRGSPDRDGGVSIQLYNYSLYTCDTRGDKSLVFVSVSIYLLCSFYLPGTPRG